MSVRKRGDKWVARVFDKTTGKQVWVGSFDERQQAREAEVEAWRNLKATKRYLATCDGFAEKWVEAYPRRKESTNLHNSRAIRKFAQDFKGRRLNDIDRVEARAWALKNRSTVKAVAAMFADAKRDGVCADNPFVDLRLQASRGRRDLVVPTEEELGEMVLQARKLHGDYGVAVYANLIQFAAYSGLRPGELAGLRWGDIDPAGRTVTVERQFNHHTRKFTSTKNGRVRTVFLTPQAAEALEATARVSEQVFTTPKGGVLHGSTASVYFKPVARAIDRPELTPHCLRHFYGTQLALRGLGPMEIAQALGHTDGGKLALSTYIHMTERDSRERIAAAFGSNVRDLRPSPVAADGLGGSDGA